MASTSQAIRNDNHNNDGSWNAPLLHPWRPSVATSSSARTGGERFLSASANVVQQLPTGSVMAFQALSSSFTNQGECHASNWWLSFVLVTLLTVSCVFFSLTDSLEYNGKVYYGVAMPARLNLFNLSKHEEKETFVYLHPELRKRRIRSADLVRAFVTAAVFLAFASGEVGIQNCFFPQAGVDTKQLLKNLPLLVAVLATFVFMAFPTKRKAVDFLISGGSTTTVPPSASGASATQQHAADVESQQHEEATNTATSVGVSSSAQIFP